MFGQWTCNRTVTRTSVEKACVLFLYACRRCYSSTTAHSAAHGTRLTQSHSPLMISRECDCVSHMQCAAECADVDDGIHNNCLMATLASSIPLYILLQTNTSDYDNVDVHLLAKHFNTSIFVILCSPCWNSARNVQNPTISRQWNIYLPRGERNDLLK